jgi:hypothetical protein
MSNDAYPRSRSRRCSAARTTSREGQDDIGTLERPFAPPPSPSSQDGVGEHGGDLAQADQQTGLLALWQLTESQPDFRPVLGIPGSFPPEMQC